MRLRSPARPGLASLTLLPLFVRLLIASIQMLIAALFASAFASRGRAGMLSFGHAAYFGMGAFATVHAMNAVGGSGPPSRRRCCR